LVAGNQDGCVTHVSTKRLFFALWPDEALRAAVARATHKAVRASGGRSVPARNLHVTLLFLGSVAADRLPQLEALAARVAGANVAPPSELVFDRIEHWEKPRVLVATASPSPGVAIAGALAAKLFEATSRVGFAPDLKSLGFVDDVTLGEFRPHVTLARKVAHPVPAADIEPVPWRVTQFALVDSRRGPDGSEYSVLATFQPQPAQASRGP
jgi:2'-5' RNA ligase